jgi:hypothetical protein
VGNWVNWLLVIGGLVCVIIELALGALTGLDLALVGGSLTVGGVIGLLAGSARIGLLAGGVLALVYLAIFRSWVAGTGALWLKLRRNPRSNAE